MTNNAKTNEMREALIERAEAMLKSRHIESPFDVSHDELPSLLADFAADVLAEREGEVVGLRSITQTVLSYAEPMLIHLHAQDACFDDETKEQLLTTLMQIRRSHKDFLALKKGEQ